MYSLNEIVSDLIRHTYSYGFIYFEKYRLGNPFVHVQTHLVGKLFFAG